MANLSKFLTVFLFIISTPALGQTSEIQFASPVFEEMLANQIISVRHTLIENKIVSSESRVFLIANKKIVEQTILALRNADLSIDWDSILFITEEPETLPGVSGEKDIVVAFGNSKVINELEARLEKSDYSPGVSFSIPELEFAKDRKGRQIVNLGEPRYEQMIFERLVREGMNPVLAHQEANKALHQLRQMGEVRVVFFFKKNLLNLLKNLDFT